MKEIVALNFESCNDFYAYVNCVVKSGKITAKRRPWVDTSYWRVLDSSLPFYISSPCKFTAAILNQQS